MRGLEQAVGLLVLQGLELGFGLAQLGLCLEQFGLQGIDGEV